MEEVKVEGLLDVLMNILFVTIVIAGIVMQNVWTKQFTIRNKRYENPELVFNAMFSLVALIFFVLISKGRFIYHGPTFIYAVLFGIAFSTATIFSVLAIKCGSLALCSLVISYSLIIPAMYGIAVLKESCKISTIIGLICVLVSLYLLNSRNIETKLTVKWIAFITLAFVGNGMCSTLQKLHQISYPNFYRTEFMIIAMVVTTIISFATFLLMKKDSSVVVIRNSWRLALIKGIANGTVNIFVMVLSVKMPASLLFPLIIAGGIVGSFFVAISIFKENLSKNQVWSLIIGVLSIVILNL